MVNEVERSIVKRNVAESQPTSTMLSLNERTSKNAHRLIPNLWKAVALPAAFGFLMSLGLMRKFADKAMKVSAWSAHHPRTAKGIIAGIQTVGSLGALIAGHYFAREGAMLSESAPLYALAGLGASAALYPRSSKRLQSFTGSYLRQKYCHMGAFTTGLALSFCLGGSLASPPPGHAIAENVSVSRYTSELHSTDQRSGITFALEQEDPPKKNGKAGAIAVSIILYVAAMLVIAALSCNLSCSGMPGLAIIVAVGVGGIATLIFVAGIRSINKNRQVKPRVQPVRELS
jgi:hypothetical protein